MTPERAEAIRVGARLDRGAIRTALLGGDVSGAEAIARGMHPDHRRGAELLITQWKTRYGKSHIDTTTER